MLLEDQNVQAEIRRLFLNKPKSLKNFDQRSCKAHVTWVYVQESTFAWINQAIKACTRILSKKMEHSDDQNVQSSVHAYFMNSTVCEKQKAKAKQICLDQQEIDTYGSWYSTWTTQSLKA
ncbi:hypothetical protein MTR_2g090780 [Medicago truncatula]|uniref:Uncharacterized protein n=1 Tax=Medicago truncatula TaxID=3880 RepID=A0A072VAZ8_MEDTR|nr:hypothetical protein MTR_2g090780 [Medicago truncatula]